MAVRKRKRTSPARRRAASDRAARQAIATELRDNSVDLPVLTLQTTLRDAFAAMKKHDRSAVVAIDGNECWLFRAAPIVVAISKHTAGTLGELPNRERIGDMTAPTQHRLTKAIAQGKSAVRGIMDALGVQHAVVGEELRMVRILTYHETLRFEAESSPRDCYCEVNDRDSVPTPEKGANCGAGHKGSIRCVK